MFAVIETGGKQYLVKQGDKIQIEKLEVQPGSTLEFDKVLIKGEGTSVEFGAPYLSDTKVSAKVIQNGRGDKEIVFKYKAKSKYRRKMGHRQHFTEVVIEKI